MRRILIVDDHPIVLHVMSAITRSVFPQAEITVAECIVDAERLAATNESVDLALLDLGLPGCEGLSALVRFRAVAPDAAAVVLSANDESSVVRAALGAGARGYIPKTTKPPVVASALRLVADGSVYVPPQALAEPRRAPEPQANGLTDRQREVLRLIAQGLANKEIARQLRIAEDTVKQHAKAVYATLGITSRVQAALAADRCGIKLD